MDQETQYPGQRMDHPQYPEVNGHRDEPTLTHSLQELESLCRCVRSPETISEYVTSYAALGSVAAVAIPELIAAIRFYNPGFHAAPSAEVTARVEALHAEAAAKRAKLDSALKDAKLGDTEALSSLGLEAYFEEDGSVKIRNKPREVRP